MEEEEEEEEVGTKMEGGYLEEDKRKVQGLDTY